MANSKKDLSLGALLLQIALAAFFIVSGIVTLQGGKGDECVIAIRTVFKNSKDLANLLCMVMGVIEVLCGALLALKLFVPIGANVNSILMLIIMIVWIVAIVLIDVLGKGGLVNGFGGNFISFLKTLSQHLLVLGAIFVVK
ncbi:MAG: hypothetical protein K5640_06805 [Treponema sp.]|nr:hypothetical protein [Treponema sp.]